MATADAKCTFDHCIENGCNIYDSSFIKNVFEKYLMIGLQLNNIY